MTDWTKFVLDLIAWAAVSFVVLGVAYFVCELIERLSGSDRG